MTVLRQLWQAILDGIKLGLTAPAKREPAPVPVSDNRGSAWDVPTAKISRHFTTHEATYLPSWKKYHQPTAQEKQNILRLALVLDQLRDFLEAPIIVHCWIRPTDYNQFVGGAPRSAHLEGLAVDFHVTGMTCDSVREKLLPKLDEFGIRMENLPGTSWVHVDIRAPGNTGRYFKP